MAARPSWSGFLRFNLISIPVKAFNAAATGKARPSFHMLHKTCHSRIRYKKVCPIHGEVDNDEIASGYEYSKGHYVIVDPEEKGGLKLEDDKAISVDTFIGPDAVDPVYYDGRTYYLVPDGKVAQKPYAVLHEAMRDQGRYGVGQFVISGRQHVVVVRPMDKLLAVELLHYQDEVKPATEYSGEVEKTHVAAEERKLAETLVHAMASDEFDLGRYKDEYSKRLKQLVEGKTAGKTVEEEPAVINLMDALKQSLQRTGKGERAAPTEKKPAKRKAASRGRHKRKTG